MSVGQGRRVRRTTNDPTGIAMCDYSGTIVQAEDRRKQMAYGGNGLYWTGLWVHKDFLDPPNPASQAPLIIQDPVVFPNPRPSEEVSGRQLQTLELDVTGATEVILNFGNVGNSPIILTGTPAGSFNLAFPVVPGNWVVQNSTNSGISVSFVGPISSTNPSYSVGVAEAAPFYSDGVTLQQTPFEP